MFLVRDISVCWGFFLFVTELASCVSYVHSFGNLVRSFTLVALVVPVTLSVESLVELDPLSSNNISVPDVLVCLSKGGFRWIWLCLCFALRYCTLGVVVLGYYCTSHWIDGEPLLPVWVANFRIVSGWMFWSALHSRLICQLLIVHAVSAPIVFQKGTFSRTRRLSRQTLVQPSSLESLGSLRNFRSWDCKLDDPIWG